MAVFSSQLVFSFKERAVESSKFKVELQDNVLREPSSSIAQGVKLPLKQE
jgi:hypothetical protein